MRSTDAEVPLRVSEHVSLCETLDRVLNKGVVVVGEIAISVADIELVYLGLQLVLTSIESGRSLGTMNVLTRALTNGADSGGE